MREDEQKFLNILGQPPNHVNTPDSHTRSSRPAEAAVVSGNNQHSYIITTASYRKDSVGVGGGGGDARGDGRASATEGRHNANWLDHPGLGEVSTLNVGNCVLSHIRGISRLASTLTVLKLGSNPLLDILPPEIGLLSRLTMLSARECSIRTVPPEIGSLRELRVLCLSAHAVESVPPELGQCRNLRVRARAFSLPSVAPSAHTTRDHAFALHVPTRATLALERAGPNVSFTRARWTRRCAVR